MTPSGAVVVGLVATAAAGVLWPATNPDQSRLRALVTAGRLAGPPRPARDEASATSAASADRRWSRWRGPPGRPAAIAGAVTVGGLVGSAVGFGAGVAAALVVLTVAFRLRSGALRRRRTARDAAVHAGLALVVAELTAGTRTGDALTAGAEAAGPFGDVFREVGAAIEHADEVPEAIGAVPPEVMPMIAAVAVATRSGSPLADVLDRARADVADRMATSRGVTSALAGARASATLLGALPVLGVVLGSGLGGAPLAVLFGTALGHGLLAVGTALSAVGVLWTDRLTTAAERPP